MTALILDYFGDWRTRLLTCSTCGWAAANLQFKARYQQVYFCIKKINHSCYNIKITRYGQ